jgi:uncharacterized membrane protein YidH (DUF202 family)
MNQIVMILAGLLVLGILIAIVIISRKNKIEMNYYSYFIIGLVWLPIGIGVRNYVLAVFGLCFLAIGLLNRKKWKKRESWSELSPQMRHWKMIAVILLAFVFILGVFLFFYLPRG